MVDDKDKLVGNISVSDLKVFLVGIACSNKQQIVGFDGAMLARLYYPVSQFLKLLSKNRSNSVCWRVRDAHIGILIALPP